ncbi:unnamed protein product [Rhizoctonia solani]|uniref:Ubiquinol-cytochrome C reductase hinge domain-containing protein n=1 Tax=Rhizoctonia solani TaxID=456999 RepID=A0A8H3GBG2_9AGAM|nr:unnamed protein product [Rhizoctonia solani]
MDPDDKTNTCKLPLVLTVSVPCPAIIMTFWSSLFPTAHAEEENPPKEEKAQEEEEEEEPEDVLPGLQEECKQTAACSGFNKHFAHCTEKVTAGQGFKGEDCVEEFFLLQYWDIADDRSTRQLVHLMHCVDNCVAPKLFSKLR